MKTKHIYGTILILLIYTFFCCLMLQITLQYFPYSTDTAFLRIKQDEIAMVYYKIAFFIHVYTSMFALLAAFTQFSDYFLKKHPKIHRRAGYLYIITVVFLSGPSGLIMAYHANGGWSSQLAFCLLAILWIYFTAMAFIKIKNKDILAHKKYMYRSFALTLSAITLRLWKYVLVAIFLPKPMDLYRWVAWLGWVVNLIIAEIIIFRFLNHNKNPN
jgi:uncharacterized membrane protein